MGIFTGAEIYVAVAFIVIAVCLVLPVVVLAFKKNGKNKSVENSPQYDYLGEYDGIDGFKAPKIGENGNYVANADAEQPQKVEPIAEKPVEAVKPVEKVKPFDIVKEVEVAPVVEKPVEAVKPVEVVKPIEEIKPVE
ncbi:MAG: hypothetical protein RSB59_04470, partial [Clostridia bacterium]